MACDSGCNCNCGYTCSRGRYNVPKCTLSIMECIEQHYEQDCGHQWDGEPISWKDPDGRDEGSSVTCSKCGLDRMSHDMRVGP